MKKYIVFGIILLIGVIFINTREREELQERGSVSDGLGNTAVTVQRMDTDTIQVSGFVRGKDEVDITPKITARISEIRISEGEHVRAGDIIAVLEGDEYVSALNTAQKSYSVSGAIKKESDRYFDEQVAISKVALEKAEELYNQAKESGDSNGRKLAQKERDIARQSLDAAKRFRDMNNESTLGQVSIAEAQRQEASIWVDETVLRAPFSGIVTRVYLDRGAMVSPQGVVASLARVDVVEVPVFIESKFQKRISVGQTVLLTNDEEGEWKGNVVSVSPGADQETQKVRVVIAVEGGEGVRPMIGSWIDVSFSLEGDRLKIFAPVSSIVKEYYDTFVWVKNGEEVQKKKVVVGDIQRDEIEIIHGLDVGETVITQGKKSL